MASSALQVASIYWGGSFIDPDEAAAEVTATAKLAELLASLGSTEMVIGGGRKRPEGNRRADYDWMAQVLNQIGQNARRLGLRACYHPHSGTCVQTGADIDLLMSITDPDLVYLCPDVAHLAGGGADPAAYIEKYLPRVGYVHLKDLSPDGRFVELGQGWVDLPRVLAVLKRGSYQGWLTVELDVSIRSPRESAEISLRFLEKQGVMA